MPLRTRLILSYAALILLLGLAAWWGVRRLTADLTDALGETAASVGRQVFTVLSHERQGEPGIEADKSGDEVTSTHEQALRSVQREVVVLQGEDAAAPPKRIVRMVVNGRELRAGRPNGREDGTESGLGPEEFAAHEQTAHATELSVRHEMHGSAPALVLSGEGFERTIPLPRAGVDAALHRYTERLGWGLAGLLALGLALSVWLAQRIARPLRALADAAQAVGRGTLGAQAPDGGVPEVRATISAFNQMSAQLQKLDAEAAALRADRELAELGEIGRGLAHSLRNPLHALGLSLEALAAQAGASNATQREQAKALAISGREQLQRVDQTLRGFLALSAGAGASAESVPLREVIDDVLLEASQRAQGRVGFRREGEEPGLIAVAAELRVMLHALVINALEASPDGGMVTVQVIAAGEPDAAVAIDVIDQGAGVPDAIRARLFQPHVSGKPHGAGMGLYLAERLARLRYRGGIALEPAAPHGTRARLRLHPREGGSHE